MAKKDLIPLNKRTIEEQKKIAKIGGLASGKARRDKKVLREELLVLLSTSNTQENICVALVKEALNGNIKAFEVIRDTIGEKPTDKVEVKPVDTNWFVDNPFENLTNDELKKIASGELDFDIDTKTLIEKDAN